jgi:hypothetical protein
MMPLKDGGGMIILNPGLRLTSGLTEFERVRPQD